MGFIYGIQSKDLRKRAKNQFPNNLTYSTDRRRDLTKGQIGQTDQTDRQTDGSEQRTDRLDGQNDRLDLVDID